MILIHYSKSFTALDRYVEGYNASQSELKEKVRQGAYCTAKEIIRLYGKVLTKAHVPKQTKPIDYPPLTTNNKQLAKMTNCSSRTIQRHLQRLLKAGILQEKKWKGRAANYELWINPLLLLTSTKLDPVQTQLELDLLLNKTTENEGFRKSKTTKCPPSETSNTGNINNIVIQVNNARLVDHHPISSPSADLDKKRRSPSFTSTVLTSYETRDTGENRRKKIEEAGENRQLRTRQNKELNAPKSSPERTASLSFYVEMLWLLAKKLLYRDAFLTERQEQIAQKLLVQWYAPVPDKHLSDVHQIYLDRIGLVRKYLNKDSRRFVPLPYLYFDPQNSNGFAGTKAWYYQSLYRKIEVRNHRILNNQIRRFLNNDKRKASERHPLIPLYQDCKKRVEALNDPQLLDQFHASILYSSNPIHLKV